MNQSKRMTDGALLTAVFIVILLASMFIPILSVAAILFLPIPFIMFTSRYDWKPALLMLVAAILSSILVATFISIPLAVPAAIGGIMIGGAIHKNLSAYETWARGTFGFIIGLLFAFVFTQVVLQVNILNEFKQITDESFKMSASLMEQFTTEEQTEAFQKSMEQAVTLLTNLFPFFLVCAAVSQALISQWLGYKLINRLERKKLRFPPFRTLRFPVSILFIYLFALFSSYMITDPDSMLFMAAQNFIFIIQMLLTIQGFSFLFFYAHHKKMTKAFPIICVVIALFMAPLLFIVRFIGIIDLGLNLRDRLEKKR
ncbi:YybS family protein [Cerasibacillus sp. JNUCC 74]